MNDSSTNSDQNMVNLYNMRLKELNLNEKLTNLREKLDQWQKDSHRIIDEYYQRKLNEFNSSTDEIQTNFNEQRSIIQTQINQLQNQQENHEQRTAIANSIENHFSDIEQISFDIHLRPLIIPENSITIEKEFHLPKMLNDCSKIFYTNSSSSAIASNQEYLLMHQDPYLLLLDQDFKIVKQQFWSYGWIRDMCWSSTLNSFILITNNQTFFINNQFEISSPVQHNFQQCWFSCTTSNDSLFLSTCQWGSSIYQFNLEPSLNLIQEYKPPLTCESYEGINDIQYNQENLALMIKNPREHKKRIELKSFKTFSTIWSLELSIGQNIRLFTCCPINTNEWLVVDGTNCRIYQISKDGKFKNDITYSSVPYRANIFASNILAIAAENDLNLYRIAV